MRGVPNGRGWGRHGRAGPLVDQDVSAPAKVTGARAWSSREARLWTGRRVLPTCQPPAHCGSHAGGTFLRIVVLPEAHRLPPVLPKVGVGVGIANPVPLQLVSPPARVGRRLAAMLRASVPEAAVHEDGNPRLPEDHVSPPPPFGEWPLVDEVAEAQAVEGAAQGQLAGGALARLTLHPVPHHVGRSGRVGVGSPGHSQSVEAANSVRGRRSCSQTRKIPFSSCASTSLPRLKTPASTTAVTTC